jgi:hypothetical protein
MNQLKYLWVYSAADQWTRDWNERLVQRRRAMGFDIESFCTTRPYFNGVWQPYPALHRKWLCGDSTLLGMYSDLLEKLRGRNVLVHYNGAMLHADFLKLLTIFKVFTCGDDPEHSEVLSKPVACQYDLQLVNNIACIEQYQSWGCRQPQFWPIGSLLEPDETGVEESSILDLDRRDVPIFIACERESPWRRERLDQMVQAFPQAYCVGRGWPKAFLDWDALWDTYRRTRIGWNLHNSTGPINFRTYDLAAFGVMQICDNRERLGKIYELGREVVGYDSMAECLAATRYYLEHPREQREIALAGWRRWREHYHPSAIWRTLAHQLEQMLANRNGNLSEVNVDAALAALASHRRKTWWPRQMERWRQGKTVIKKQLRRVKALAQP